LLDIEACRQEEVPIWRTECWQASDPTTGSAKRQRKNVITKKIDLKLHKLLEPVQLAHTRRFHSTEYLNLWTF